jgi:serine/threonine protein kinase
MNGGFNNMQGTRNHPIMIDSSRPMYYSPMPNPQPMAHAAQANGDVSGGMNGGMRNGMNGGMDGGMVYPKPMASGMMQHHYQIGIPVQHPVTGLAAPVSYAAALQSTNETAPPSRPGDRKADGYKEQINAWYDWVEERIEKRTGYVVKQNLGQGGQGRAILLEQDVRQPGPKQVVVKIFAKERDAKIEIDFLRSYSRGHSNLVSMLENWQPNFRIPGVSALALEYCDQGTLYEWRDRYRQRQQAVPESAIWHVAISIARALAYLHSGHSLMPVRSSRPSQRQPFAIVHRDIKPENVLLLHDTSQPYNIAVKLGDFGLAEKLTRYGPQWNNVYCSAGTHDWQPREQVAGPHIAGPEQDIWSLGAIIHFLALGEPPIDMRKIDNSLEVNSKIWKASIPRRVTKISSRPDLRKGLGHQKSYRGDGHKSWSLKYSIKLNRWMMRMLERAPEDRPTAVEVMTKMWDDRPPGCK